MTGRLTKVGTGLAVAGAAHAALNVALLRRPVAATESGRKVSVLIPARNEAPTIVDCLAALKDQDVTEILVLDDESTDGTGAIAAAVNDPRVRVIAGTSVPAGWLGKPHACTQLAAAADPATDVLVFLDADVRLEPGAVASAVGMLDRHGLDLVSPHPRQVAVTASERLVQPLLQWSILTLMPLRIAERSKRRSLAAANGQFIVVRRSTYTAAGGHRPNEVLDDIALARAVRASGGRGAVVDGTTLASCRMYAGWPQLRDGYTKSLWSAFGPPRQAAVIGAALGLAYVLPPLAALRGSKIGLFGYLAAVLSRVITTRATGGRALPDSFAHPVSISVAAALTARSHRERARGRLSWRGRRIGSLSPAGQAQSH